VTGVRAGVETDRAAVIDLLLRAFEADPCFRWWFPSDEAWAERAPELFGINFDLRIAGGGEVLVTEPVTSVAMWTPPGGNRQGEDAVSRLWVERAGRFEHQELHRMLSCQLAMAAHAPDGAHWALGFLATDPEQQGRGHARLVLDPILELAAQDATPVHLETAVAANVSFYEHLGFELIAEYWLPDGGPQVWGLLRR